MSEMPEPGIHRDVPFAEYAAWDAANAHGLGLLAKKTPAHLRWSLDHGEGEPTVAKDFGHLFHSAVLEPDRFAAEYAVAPVCNRGRKEGKTIWAEFVAAHPDATIVKGEDHADILAMRASLMAHPVAAEFFGGPGLSEACIVWDEDGLRCKARFDKIGSIGYRAVIGDLKTTTDASPRAVERAVHLFGYDVQGAHYIAGTERVVPQPAGNPHRAFVLFMVEKDPPHAVAVYEVDDVAIAEGERKRKLALARWRQCRETRVWPGYGDGIDTVSVPAWALKNYGEGSAQI